MAIITNSSKNEIISGKKMIFFLVEVIRFDGWREREKKIVYWKSERGK